MKEGKGRLIESQGREGISPASIVREGKDRPELFFLRSQVPPGRQPHQQGLSETRLSSPVDRPLLLFITAGPAWDW
jgi:hypothetical protein